MSCEFSQMHLHAYLDSELDARSAAAFESHLKSCAECQSALASEEALRSAIIHADLYERAPSALRQSLAAQLPGSLSAPHQTTAKAVSPAWRWLALAASFLLVATLGWQLLQHLRSGVAPRSAVVTAALDAHLRSLQPGHLADVPSTDQHTVKPWFDGKLDFAPPVRDFAADGFPLLGGRIDILDGKTVAAVVYGRRKHLINVFAWPDNAPDSATASGQSNGYNWASWHSGGFAFCAVSDVSSADLRQLTELFAGP